MAAAAPALAGDSPAASGAVRALRARWRRQVVPVFQRGDLDVAEQLDLRLEHDPELLARLAASFGNQLERIAGSGAADVLDEVRMLGRDLGRQAGKAVTDEGEGGKQIADFLAEIKVI